MCVSLGEGFIYLPLPLSLVTHRCQHLVPQRAGYGEGWDIRTEEWKTHRRSKLHNSYSVTGFTSHIPSVTM